MASLKTKTSTDIEPNAFAGRATKPAEAALIAVLGKSYAVWETLLSNLRQALQLSGNWHTGSIKMGWSFRLQKKDRNIVYLGPRQGWFLASFVLGDRAVAAAKQSELPPDLLKQIASAKRYAEGTPVRIEVKELEDLAAVELLARIKTDN